jgi:4-hydroxy-tetrahydrodipicolinate synthase
MTFAKPLSFEGTYTALVTPFTRAAPHPIDWDAYAALIEAQIAGGITGLVPCGTTGESPTFTEAEHLEVIARTVTLAAGRVPVIAGTGSNSTAHAIHLSKHAERLGADAVMVVVPYYNKPTQEGLLHHFTAVAKSVGIPVVLYNIPGRCGTDLSADTLARIREAAPNVYATKEATGNVTRCMEIVAKLGDAMTVLCGDDGLTLPMISVGARGVISVTSNLLPREVTTATALALSGNMHTARKSHAALLELHAAMFLEANPGPLKAALEMRGLMASTVRQPLCEVSTATAAALRQVLSRHGLLT